MGLGGAQAEAVGAEPLASDEHTAERVMEATGGRGVDSVIEAVGRDESIRLAIDLVRVDGTVSVVGVPYSPEMSYPLATSFERNVTFRMGLADVHGSWSSLLPLVLSGRLRPERTVTDRMTLSDGAEAYARYSNRDAGVMKVVIDPAE